MLVQVQVLSSALANWSRTASAGEALGQITSRIFWLIASFSGMALIGTKWQHFTGSPARYHVR